MVAKLFYNNRKTGIQHLSAVEIGAGGRMIVQKTMIASERKENKHDKYSNFFGGRI